MKEENMKKFHRRRSIKQFRIACLVWLLGLGLMLIQSTDLSRNRSSYSIIVSTLGQEQTLELRQPMGIAVTRMKPTNTDSDQILRLGRDRDVPLPPIFVSNTNRYQVVRVVDATSYRVVAGELDSPGSDDTSEAHPRGLLMKPTALAVGPANQLFICDTGKNAIRMVSTGSNEEVDGDDLERVTTVVTGLNSPQGIAFDSAGTLFVADTGNHRIVRVEPNGSLTVVAGETGEPGLDGENVPATEAHLFAPSGLAFDHSTGNLYISDMLSHRIRMITPGTDPDHIITAGSDAANEIIKTVAGSGNRGCRDDPQATLGQLNQPFGLALGPGANLFIADQFSHRIRMVTPGSNETVDGGASEGIGVVAGCTPCFSGGGCTPDGVLAPKSKLRFPNAVAVDSSGRIFIADTNNNRILVIVDGIVMTVVPPPPSMPCSDAACP
jgi:sugar lactone lactonase YvrE